ncbi:hypothetical protein AX768_02105 [Burkholderia sp. PAMC 28687]|nr:hypothetical protein AX768_02105 [Burkholderia sp. PAMC 28687]
MKALLTALLLATVALTVHAEQQPEQSLAVLSYDARQDWLNGVAVVSERNGDAANFGAPDVLHVFATWSKAMRFN